MRHDSIEAVRRFLASRNHPTRCLRNSSSTRDTFLLVCALVALGAGSGCQDSNPYSLSLHVPEEQVCDEYEDLVIGAVDFWSDHGVDAFVYDGCEAADYDLNPVFHWTPGERAIADHLDGDRSRVPVYVVESITLDNDGELSSRRGVTSVSETVACPYLVAVSLPRIGLLAHELGHSLWLDHVEQYGNVMFDQKWPTDPDDISVTRSQLHDAHAHFERCNDRRR